VAGLLQPVGEAHRHADPKNNRDNDEALAFLDISQRGNRSVPSLFGMVRYVFYVMQKVDDNSVEN